MYFHALESSEYLVAALTPLWALFLGEGGKEQKLGECLQVAPDIFHTVIREKQQLLGIYIFKPLY
jgi:hypothetical protein